jgi:hypothetical protein
MSSLDDQSPGKSSVLEAISRLAFQQTPFFVRDSRPNRSCGGASKTNTLATNVPGDDRTASDKETLETWKSNDFELGEFPFIVDLARRAMGLTSRKNSTPTHKNVASSDRAISSDVL